MPVGEAGDAKRAVVEAGGGQRVATMMVYMSTPLAGGDTHFPQALPNPLRIPAIHGNALFWRNVNRTTYETDPLSAHAGMPVTEGIKYSLTRWMRANPRPLFSR